MELTDSQKVDLKYYKSINAGAGAAARAVGCSVEQTRSYWKTLTSVSNRTFTDQDKKYMFDRCGADTDRQIAQYLGVSVQRVRKYRKHVLRRIFPG